MSPSAKPHVSLLFAIFVSSGLNSRNIKSLNIFEDVVPLIRQDQVDWPLSSSKKGL